MCPGVPHLPTPAPLASQSTHVARTTLRARPPAGAISAPSAAPLPHDSNMALACRFFKSVLIRRHRSTMASDTLACV